MTQPSPSPNSFMQQDEKKASRTRSPRGKKSPVVECLDGPCKDYLKLQDQEWLQIWEKCSYAQRQVDEKPSKRSKKE